MTSNTNKIIAAVVAIAIIISIAVLVYVNLPKQTEEDTTPEDSNDHKANPAILTLVYDDEQKNLTLGEIERLEPYTAKGGYRNQKGFIKGVGNYTGVDITTLVNEFQPAPYHYSLQVITEDGLLANYTYAEIQGNVDIYNPDDPENSTPMGLGNLTMVLAYQFEGNYLNESSDGKLRIVYLDEQGSITDSGLWLKMVTSIRIITE